MHQFLLAIVLSILFTECFGYFLHILLHSQKIEFLSRNHMIHHLKIYGPQMPQRNYQYQLSTESRASILGIGMEWVFPILVTIFLIIGIGLSLKIEAALISTFIVVALVWGYFLFGYMHNSMHLKGFWMEKNRFLKKWYLHIRKLHDIHHLHLNDEGKMNVNYGICFFFFDHIFGSFKSNFSKFNHHGLMVAIEKYKFISK